MAKRGSEQRLSSCDRDMVAMIRRYKRVVRAARNFVLAETFAPHKVIKTQKELMAALHAVESRRLAERKS